MPVWKASVSFCLCGLLAACNDAAPAVGPSGPSGYTAFITDGGYRSDIAAVVTSCDTAMQTGQIDPAPLSAAGYGTTKRRLYGVSAKRSLGPVQSITKNAIVTIGKDKCTWSASPYTTDLTALYLATGEALITQGYTLVTPARNGVQPKYSKQSVTLELSAASWAGSATSMNFALRKVDAQ